MLEWIPYARCKNRHFFSASADGGTSTSAANAGIPFLGTDFNVDDLYQRLIASGFLKSTTSTAADKKEDTKQDAVKKVSFDKPETFKV